MKHFSSTLWLIFYPISLIFNKYVSMYLIGKTYSDDAVAFEQDYKRIVEKAGGIYVGIQETIDKHVRLVLFTEPITKTTRTVRADQMSVEAVKQKLKEARIEFS